MTCVYFDCDNGTTKVGCGGGTTANTSPSGHPGCCTYGGELRPSISCQGSISKDATMWIQVSSSLATSCFDYELEYHY